MEEQEVDWFGMLSNQLLSMIFSYCVLPRPAVGQIAQSPMFGVYGDAKLELIKGKHMYAHIKTLRSLKNRRVRNVATDLYLCNMISVVDARVHRLDIAIHRHSPEIQATLEESIGFKERVITLGKEYTRIRQNIGIYPLFERLCMEDPRLSDELKKRQLMLFDRHAELNILHGANFLFDRLDRSLCTFLCNPTHCVFISPKQKEALNAEFQRINGHQPSVDSVQRVKYVQDSPLMDPLVVNIIQEMIPTHNPKELKTRVYPVYLAHHNLGFFNPQPQFDNVAMGYNVAGMDMRPVMRNAQGEDEAIVDIMPHEWREEQAEALAQYEAEAGEDEYQNAVQEQYNMALDGARRNGGMEDWRVPFPPGRPMDLEDVQEEEEEELPELVEYE